MYTWKHWDLVQGQTLYVNIVNSDKFPSEKIDIIKDTILSKNSFVEYTSGVSQQYYTGWMGALEKIDEKQILYNLLVNIEIVDSDESGDIIIHLSSLKDEDGINGFTKLTVEDENILRSHITIYDIDEISNEDLSVISRHEFGHALGLSHSTDPQDLMHPSIESINPYISECNVDAITSLYDGGESNHVICEK